MKRPALTLSTLCLSLALLACSDTNKTSNTNNAEAKTSPTTELAEHQEIVINNITDPISLDPHILEGVVEMNLVRQMFEGLTQTDQNGKTIAGVAESWHSDDNKTWTFKLKKTTWSNGDALTAHDFVYSFRRLVDPKTASPYASYLSDAKIAHADAIQQGKTPVEQLGVKAIDDNTLQITLSDPVPYLPDMLFHSSTYPVHQATVEKFGDKWTQPEHIVSNGAYTLSQWTLNDKVVMQRNSKYYDDAKTKINKVTFLALNDGVADLARFRTGEIDISGGNFPTEQFQAVQKEMGDQLSTQPILCTFYYGFNNAKPPFNDIRVRKALSWSLDREIMTEKILGQGQVPAYHFTPPTIAGGIAFKPEWQSWDKNKRIDEAKKLLTEAGYSKDKPLQVELLYNTDEQNKKMAIAATEMWKQALDGAINVTLINQEWKTYLERRQKGEYQIMRARWCGDYNDASTFLNLYKSTSTNNDPRYHSAAFDDLLNQSLKAGVTEQQRHELYAKAEAQLDADMPSANVYYYVAVRLVKPHVLGVAKNDPLNNYYVKHYSIAKH